MENRERDRKVPEEEDREKNSGTSAEFGESIGRAEKLEPAETERTTGSSEGRH